jgi:tetratricopeptide (TPR) repeat protein
MKDDFKGGLADYNKAIQFDPKDADSWNNRGIAKREIGDKTGAIADLKKALEINPELESTRQLLRQLGVKL